MERVLVLDDEEILIKDKLKNLQGLFKTLWEEKGIAATESAQDRKENTALDIADRAQTILSKQINELLSVLDRINVVSKEQLAKLDKTIVTIWKSVKIIRDGKEMNIKIGWYQTLVEWRISYTAPLIQALLGRKIGDIIETEINWESVEIEIAEVSIIN